MLNAGLFQSEMIRSYEFGYAFGEGANQGYFGFIPGFTANTAKFDRGISETILHTDDMKLAV
jgi:hypothetical protein